MTVPDSFRTALPGAVLLAATLALSGCVAFSPDGGFDTVREAAKARLGHDLTWVRSDADRDRSDARIAELLAQPLGADEAVQVALLSNRGLQASFAELGVSEADYVQSGRLANPHFSMFRASAVDHGVREFKIEQVLTFNLFALVTMPHAIEAERRRFEQTQRQVALDVLRLASDVRRAYYEAVAADETVRYMRQVRDAADAGSELARRMAAAGNWSRLAEAREQTFQADAALSLARAEQAATGTRERLVRALGLWGTQALVKLPSQLPALPAAAEDRPDIEQAAMATRLDLAAARKDAEALAATLGLARATRLVNVFELGPARVLEGPADGQYKYGYEVSFQLPLFDWGGARVARAEAIYRQALDRAAERAINARSEVREAYSTYRSTYDIARYYRDQVVPLRKRISEENLLRYNGMLIGVFELLADARVQITTVAGYIEALRDFWIADAGLRMAMVGRPATAPLARAASPAAGTAGAAH